MILRKTIVLLLVTSLLLNACGDDPVKDNSETKLEFSFDDKPVGWKNANIYLMSENAFEDTYTYRKYLITDGAYEDLDFTNATYFIEVLLAVPAAEEEFSVGEYSQWFWWADAPETENISYVHASSAVDNDDPHYFSFETIDDDDSNHNPIAVTGGFDDGEAMTLAFNGTLNYYHFSTEANDWAYEHVSGKLHFKGKVHDKTTSQK